MENKLNYKGYSFEVSIDEMGFSDSPRTWSNLGYFITSERNYKSPDEDECLERIIRETGESASTCDEHIDAIKQELADWEENIIAIYPVSKYEHGGVSYSLGEQHGFDSGVSGFYIITEQSQKEIGINNKDFEKVIRQELETYTAWANGEIYQYYIEEMEDSCCGYYSHEEAESAAKESIDWDIKSKGRAKRSEEARKESVKAKIKVLNDIKLESEEESVKRHCTGIIKKLELSL